MQGTGSHIIYVGPGLIEFASLCPHDFSRFQDSNLLLPLLLSFVLGRSDTAMNR
jgi:hypothetical protein